MNGQNRKDIRPGLRVDIVLKQDQRSGKRTRGIVKDILLLEKTDTSRLSGKTGSGQLGGVYTGWFVGFMESRNDVYFFATNIRRSSAAANGARAKEIALRILQYLR